MKFKMTPKQRMWFNIFGCAVKRSFLAHDKKDYDRYQREHATVVLALQLGDQFWKEFL